MKNFGTILIVIIVVAVVGYAGYHLYTKQMQQQNLVQPQVVEQPTTAAGSPSAAAMTETNAVFMMKTDSKLGSYMADPKGMTLYTFTKDTAGVSNCTASCLVAWPAYVAPAKTGTFPANIGVITRPDGTLQYAWKDKPLYHFAKDKNAGDTTGQGVGGVWYIAQ